MRKLIFHIAASLSLMFFTIVVVDRVSQHWHMHWIGYAHNSVADPQQTDDFAITTGSGVIMFSVGTIVDGAFVPSDRLIERGFYAGHDASELSWKTGEGFFRNLGFGDYHWARGTPGDPTKTFVVNDGFSIPNWFAAATFAVLPILWGIFALRNRMRRKLGRCSVCGYDLRATPERCPECGDTPLPVKIPS